MKKILQLSLFVLMLAVTSMASAASEKSTLQEGADLSSIHKLAIAAPNYYQTDSKAPTYDDFVEILYNASKSSRTEVIPYSEFQSTTKAYSRFNLDFFDPNVLKQMKGRMRSEIADAYLVATIANPRRPNFFFEVYDAKTNELLYTYQTVLAKTSSKSVKNYQEICETFYKKFDKLAVDQAKKKK